MIDKLVDASVQNDVVAINEVATLMKEIQGAWNAIPPEVVTQTVTNSHENAQVG
jgi:flagellin-specific chaperone FliS